MQKLNTRIARVLVVPGTRIAMWALGRTALKEAFVESQLHKTIDCEGKKPLPLGALSGNIRWRLEWRAVSGKRLAYLKWRPTRSARKTSLKKLHEGAWGGNIQ